MAIAARSATSCPIRLLTFRPDRRKPGIHFRVNLGVEVAAACGCSGASGSQTFSTPGSTSFTVPCYGTLTVKVWGGGGAGAVVSGIYVGFTGGGPGAASSFNSSVIANGGGTGWNAVMGTTGTPGTATGGDTNTTGNAGTTGSWVASGTGGSAPGGGGAGGSGGSICGMGPPGSAPGGADAGFLLDRVDWRCLGRLFNQDICCK